jgi:hypothetical protein
MLLQAEGQVVIKADRNCNALHLVALFITVISDMCLITRRQQCISTANGLAGLILQTFLRMAVL